MKHVKKLALALTFALVFAGSALAGETNTPPCPQPLPGETNTPPCNGGSNVIGDPSEASLAQMASAAVDDIAADALLSAIESVFMIL